MKVKIHLPRQHQQKHITNTQSFDYYKNMLKEKYEEEERKNFAHHWQECCPKSGWFGTYSSTLKEIGMNHDIRLFSFI
jgi:hypothetical protein